MIIPHRTVTINPDAFLLSVLKIEHAGSSIDLSLGEVRQLCQKLTAVAALIEKDVSDARWHLTNKNR